MSEYSLYFVPENQGRFIGRENEVAESFWEFGVFLATEDDFVFERIEQFEDQGKPLPEWKHDFEFGEMGLSDEAEEIPVPQELEALEPKCPHCGEEILEQAYDVYDDLDDTPAPLRPIRCVGCGKNSPFKNLKFGQPMTFARFFLWVQDTDPDNDGEDFRRTVELVLGPCTIYRSRGV